MIKLVVLLNGHEVLDRTLEPGEYTLGRSPDCDVLLDHTGIEEVHARLQVSPQGVSIASHSGQWNLALDGEAVAQAELPENKPVFIGVFELRWQAAPEQETPAQEEEPAPAEAEPDVGERTVVYGAQDDFHDQATVVGPAPDAPGAVLELREGELSQQRYRLSPGKTVLGRSPDCGLSLPHPTISRRHAELEVSPQGVRVRDLGSTSGIMVNEQPTQEAELAPGDRLRLGAVVLELVEAPGPARPETPAPAPPAAKKKKKKAKKAKPARKQAPAGLAAAGGKNRRPLLYGAAGAAVLILVIALVFSGGKKKAPPVPLPEQQAVSDTQQELERDQIRRMVLINLAKGKKALNEKAYPRALEFLEQVLAVDPKNAEAQKLKAQAQEAMARARELRLKQEQEEAARVREAQKLLAQTEQAFQSGDYAQTLELGKKVLAVSPNQPLARHLVMKAQAALERAEREKRQEEIYGQKRQALARQYLALARRQLKKKDLKGARASLHKVLEAQPPGQGPEAAAAQKLLAQVEPRIRARANAYYKKGKKLLKRGRLEAAVSAFNRALAADPEHKQAAQALARARKKAAKLAHKLYQEGAVLRSLGKRKQACAKWRRALKLVDSQSPVYASIKEKLALCAN